MMAPHEINELKDIIDMINAPLIKSIDRAISGQDELRRLIDQITGKQVAQEERIKSVEEDARKIFDKIDALEENIIKNQQKRFTQVIGTQAALLLLIIAGFIAYFFSLPPFH